MRNRPYGFVRLIGLLAALLVASIWLACERGDTGVQQSDEPKDRSSGLHTADVDANLKTLSGGLVGSKHDFTRDGSQPHDLCLTCHTPHLSRTKAPLLDRRPAALERLRSYQAYAAELDSTTLLCLSCHDGLIASDVFSSSHATSLATQLASSQIGTRRFSSHPIGVVLPVNDPTYRSAETVTADGTIKLPGGRVQCISGHDPHNTRRHPAMLVQSNQQSRLCLSCHRL